jgi:hypothetical protein
MGAASTNVFTLDGNTVTGDSIACSGAVAYGGKLVINTNAPVAAGQSYTLFTAGTTMSGSFSSIQFDPGPGLIYTFTNGVLTISSSGLATITTSLSGNILSLSWPSGQGWRLESQTNSLTSGLSATGWGTVPGVSDGSATITVDPSQPTVFYRLANP